MDGKTNPDARPLDIVVITLPADSAYLSVLRTATAGLAARLDFTIDEIEDLAGRAALALAVQEMRTIADEGAARLGLATLVRQLVAPGLPNFSWGFDI